MRTASHRDQVQGGRHWPRGLHIALILLGLLAFRPAEAAAAGRHATMAIDANTGKVLHAQAADDPRYPASLTKMMTLYIVFEMMEQGRLSPLTRIRISPNAANTAPSKLGLDAGSEIALIDAVQALIVKSANDMAVAVAEHIAGSEAKFASLMTQKARQLGMSATTFRNPHGLPDPGQVTTARDMLTLALRLNDDFPRRYAMFAQRSFSYRGVMYRNHNTMLSSYQGMDGLKTGYTGASGFNLVASVRRDGKHVVAAVFGGSSAAARNAYMRTILDRSLARASTERTRKAIPVARAPRPEQTAEARPLPKLIEPVRQVERPVAAAAPARPAPVAVAERPVPETPPARDIAPAAPAVEMARVRTVAVTPKPRAVVEPAPVAEIRASGPPLTVASLPSPPSPTAAVPSPAGLGRGLPPSSLQEQAQRLQRGEPPAPTEAAVIPAAVQPAPRAKSPPVPAPSAHGSVTIQVGAYATEAEALRQLQAIQARAGTLLGSARPVAQPVTAGGRQLFRARFSGLEPAAASSACNELRRQRIDCMVAAGG